MDDFKKNQDGSITREVTKDGKTVTVLAEKAEPSKWCLSILGKSGVSSNWHEFFPSPEAAITKGTRAIELEGIDEFYTSEFYAYMENR